MNKNLFKISLLFVMTCFFAFHAFSQAKADWEMLGSTSTPTSGQTLTATATMAYNSGNPTNNNVINFPNPLTTTVTLKNPQYSWSNPGRISSNVIAGAGGPVIKNLGSIGSAINSYYTSNGASPGTGIDITSNQGFEINNYTAPLRENNVPTATRNYIGDIEISFSRPVNNPIIHLSGLGGNATPPLNFTTEFDVVTSNIGVPNLTKLSGNSFLSVTSSQINSTASVMNGTTNAVYGSVQVNGKGITTVTFKMFLRGDQSVSPQNWASSSTGTSADGFTLSVSAVEDMGYIYVHKKAVSEVASVDFDYNLADSSGSSFYSFKLNDKPDSVGNAFDIGNSHGAGEGQLWAVLNESNYAQEAHSVSGTLYTRPVGSSQWVAISAITNARSVDGIGSGTAIYSDELGAVYLYNSTSTKIWDPAAHASVQIIDVASGGTGKVLAAVGNDGKIYKYIGDGTNDSWQVFANVNPTGTAPTEQKAFRIDVYPNTEEIYFIRSNGSGNIWKLASANPATANPVQFSTGPTGNVADKGRDIAVSNNGTVFANYGERIYWKDQTSGLWTNSAMTRTMYALTAGEGDQAWSVNKNNSDMIQHSIFTKATAPVPAGTEPVWLDDERIRLTTLGNSIMIPVPAGTYKLSEIDNPAWNNNDITIYDPTNNSSFNLLNNESTINVATGEVVNVVYTNSLKNVVNIPNICTTNYVVTFDGTAASSQNGPPINGFTSYHHRTARVAADGYYVITKDNQGWFASSPDRMLKDHTVDSSGNPVNGYFAIFNASYSKDDFFRQTVTGLVPGVIYELAFWVADVGPTFAIRPNVTMGIVDPVSGANMATPINTGDISATEWKRYSAQFVATASTAEIYLRNNSIGGNGNDLAIDDISFAPAPPPLPPIQAPPGFTSICNSKSSNPEQYQFTIANPGSNGTGVWSTDNSSLVTINPTTGLATAGYGTTGGTAEIIYRFTSDTGCMSEAKFAVTVGNCVCNNPVTNLGTPNPTKHGITLLKRAGENDGGWPMNRPSAHTVLESNTKGFVPTRISKNDLVTVKTITNPQEGMMVYDTTDKCLKIYSDGVWSCFNTQTCP